MFKISIIGDDDRVKFQLEKKRNLKGEVLIKLHFQNLLNKQY